MLKIIYKNPITINLCQFGTENAMPMCNLFITQELDHRKKIINLNCINHFLCLQTETEAVCGEKIEYKNFEIFKN